MKNLIKISFLTMMTLILIGCSVDEDVQAVADNLVNEENGLTADIAMCMAKEQKANLSSEDWDVVVGMANGTAEFGDLSKDSFTVAMAAGMKCGAPMAP
mgnify:CR=1 FL=1